MDDKIKLAEAMGWKDIPAPKHLPDPFIDANDDYAVLEWMLIRTPDSSHGRIYLGNKWDYKIGDYARAALKVLNGQT